MSVAEPRPSQESTRATRPKPLPILLESFPVPPSFIPPGTAISSPFSASNPNNPPPSLPPSSPLPPLPGPSPISEEETVLLLSSSRHRRLSRLSTHSTSSSKRDSTATIASITSIGSNGVPALSPSVSCSSSTSQSTNSSSRPRAASTASVHSLHSFSSNGSLSVAPPLLSRSQSSDKSPRLSPALETVIKEEDDTEEVPHKLAINPYSEDEASPRILPIASANDSISSIDMRDLPSDGYIPPLHSQGRLSPDIRSIISSTPRPRKRTPSILSLASSPRPSSRPPSTVTKSQRSSAASATSVHPTLTRSDSSSDPLYVQRRVIPLDESNSDFDELERKLEGNGSESDSSLDLHTPFAHVMLRDGLISPRSKVIAQLSPAFQRPGSMVSINSVRTKSGVYKDERDTLKRRHRHRDGKLLKGGIGLTTGLGWSDSEDEDSPSPLTRRLSSLAKSRKSSIVSLRSTYSAHEGLISRRPSDASDVVPPTPRLSPSAAYSTRSPLSTSSSSSLRLPITPETGEDSSSPPPLPPKDPSFNVPRKSSTTSLHSQTTGPRPLKLTQSSSVLRSSSLGHQRTDVQTAPPVSRPRTYSQPSSVLRPLHSKASPTVVIIPGKIPTKPTIPSPASSKSTPPSALTGVSPPGVQVTRPRSRIGTGMMYRRSTSETTPGVRPVLLSAPSTSSGGNLRRPRMPSSPLQSVAAMPHSPTSAGLKMEVGIAI